MPTIIPVVLLRSELALLARRVSTASGAYAGCWCMFWRVERSQFKAQKGAGNREERKEPWR